MTKPGWGRCDRFMRTVHLYTGLFLVPWMVVYGLSAFCLNHHQWFIQRLGIQPPRWEVVRQEDFVPPDDFPVDREGQARAILDALDLAGPHRVQPMSGPQQMIIFRICGTGNYRVTWRRPRSLLVVEKQPFSAYRLLHFLHFRAGYGQPYLAHTAWAVLVDAVGIGILFWAVSGIYIWARRPKKRLLGGICLIAGTLAFTGLVIMLCQ